MSTTAIPIDPPGGRLQQNRNLVDTLLLITGMTLLTGGAAFLFLSWSGLLVAVLCVGLIAFAAPHMPAATVLRLYRAMPIDTRNGRDLYLVLHELAARGGMQSAPSLYVVPSLTLSAFSTGSPDNAAIAITEGLLRKLSLRQIAAVLGHELAHIRNEDLRLMALADALSRTLQVMSWLGLALLLFYIPQYAAGNVRVPWLGIGLLYVAPALGTLLQLALARTREYEADLAAMQLTGDPTGLASALRLIERYRGQIWEDLAFPNTRRSPAPSSLRTHPSTEARLARLRAAASTVAGQTPIAFGEDGPRVSLVGMGPVAMRARYRMPGVWF